MTTGTARRAGGTAQGAPCSPWEAVARQGLASPRSVGVFLALAAAAALVLVPLPRPTRGMAALEDLGHVVIAAVLAAWLATGFRSRTPARRAFLAASLAASFLAALELAQPLVARTASVGDALLDLGGAAAGGLLAVAVAVPRGRRAATVGLVATGVLGISSWAPAATILDVWAQARAFPLLCSFESRVELDRWSVEQAAVSLDPRHATDGRSSLRVALDPGRYPGIELEEPPPDWSEYEELRFDAYLQGDAPLDVSIRLVDARHDGRYEDRFNAQVSLQPGANRIRIPLSDVRSGPRGRDFDLQRVSGLMLFVPGLAAPRSLFLDDVRLVLPRDVGGGTRVGVDAGHARLRARERED